jgi:hypothetical protein
MKIGQWNGTVLKVHFEISDNYEITDNNGVDVYFTKEQIKEMIDVIL